MKHATPRQTEPDQMTDLTLSATFANEAQEDIARADEETRSKFKAGWIKSASIDAAARGVAPFNDAVAAGSMPRALPYDCALKVIVALEAAGLKIVRDKKGEAK